MSVRKPKKSNGDNELVTTLMNLGDVSFQTLKDDTGYHIALVSKDGYRMRRVTKKTHDLLIKALADDK